MNSKSIKKHLNAKMKDWVESIDDANIKSIIKNNTIITGGALVSLLTGEPVNDYDVYFRTKDAALVVATYYANKWNDAHKDGKQVTVSLENETGKIKCFISSAGVVSEEEPTDILFDKFDEKTDTEENNTEPEKDDTGKPKYRPVFITANAITLLNKIQIVTRFYGEVEDIHKNYDFVHCTCVWSSWDNELNLPAQALECIINKELQYVGSKYPLCSIIRTRKFLERGYTINAGQYVKMAMQLNELNLREIKVLEDQLTGVDTTYFSMLIEALDKKYSDGQVDNAYVIELVNRMF